MSLKQDYLNVIDALTTLEKTVSNLQQLEEPNFLTRLGIKIPESDKDPIIFTQEQLVTGYVIGFLNVQLGPMIKLFESAFEPEALDFIDTSVGEYDTEIEGEDE